MATHWASRAIEALARGESATVVPHGHSMRPKILSGSTVTLDPLREGEPGVGDAVLVRVKGTVYLHLVKALRGSGGDTQYQIGSARGSINGWVRRSAIYGKVVEVTNPRG
jgi:hypothetical protein